MRAIRILTVVAVLALVLALVGEGVAAPATSSDLAVTKTDSPDPVVVGTPLTYVTQVRNLVPAEATGVVVTDRLPRGADFVSAVSSVGSCKRAGSKVTCDLGTIGAPTVDYSGPPSVTLTVVPRLLGTASSTVSVDGKQKDPVGANNHATATTQVVGPPVTCQGVPATIVGTPGDDTLGGTDNPDVIAALGGDDTIYASSGRDLVCAGSGLDRVAAGSAADRVYGGAGSDSLLGRGGPDLLKGGAGGDVLRGNRGSDRLRGGSGRDVCRGGSGADSTRSCERTR